VFRTDSGSFAAVDGVSFDVMPGEVLGIVGESGSGKSVTALSVLRLIPDPPGRVTDGRILFEGQDLLTASPAELRRIRGGRISMIFQEPMTSLNPVFSIAEQLTETIRAHDPMSRRAARARAIELLAKVGIPDPHRRIDDYPHQMSGGMRQRVMIAMALSCRPSLLLADEPTTALDVSIQAQILELLRSLQEEFRMAVVLITHNLGIVAEYANRVAVMYAGRVVELADVADIFDHPRHPYTEGLLASIPALDREEVRLRTIPGVVPAPGSVLAGCRFRSRCTHAEETCARIDPPLVAAGRSTIAACLRLDRDGATA
jgi:peptide/nickel transport system ATP-binding protein/oligopeptide transport system ATP-binding protein